jgi:hypothetical protein
MPKGNYFSKNFINLEIEINRCEAPRPKGRGFPVRNFAILFSSPRPRPEGRGLRGASGQWCRRLNIFKKKGGGQKKAGPFLILPIYCFFIILMGVVLISYRAHFFALLQTFVQGYERNMKIVAYQFLIAVLHYRLKHGSSSRKTPGVRNKRF